MDNTLEPPNDFQGFSPRMGSHQSHFSTCSYQGQGELFYENYGASDYASTSTSNWHQQSSGNSLLGWSYSTSCSATRHRRLSSNSQFGGILDSPVLGKHVGLTSRTPPSPPASQPTLTRDLPPADPDTDYMDHDAVYSRHFGSEGSLSSLSEWQNNRMSLYLSMGFPGELGAKGDALGASIHSDDEETSPERGPYPALLDIFSAFDKGSMSPESVETDLDDESILSSSTSSLSPSYQDSSELRHSFEDDEGDEEEDQEDPYFAHASSFRPMTDRYHPLEEYPSHFQHLYSNTQLHSPQPFSGSEERLQDDDMGGVLQPPSPFRLSPSLSPLDFDGQHEREPPLPSLEFFPPPHSERPEGSGLGLSLLSSSSAHIPQFPSSFPSFYNFDDDPTTIPSSPSRRRSTDLPSLDDGLYPDSFGLQGPSTSLTPAMSTSTSASESTAETQRTHFLTLPGGETDDDLIPRELASKNYVPDPTITVPTTSLLPSSAEGRSLLIWDPSGSFLGLDAKDGVGYHYPPARSPSPEHLDLDPVALAELSPEARRVYELKQKTSKGLSWEQGRERSRELSALLRLKLGLDEKPDVGSSSVGDADQRMVAKADDEDHLLSQASSGESGSATARRSASLPTQTSTSIAGTASTSNGSSSSQQEQTRRSSSKHKITSMAQLVANMVFHRQQQQDPVKRTPPRSRSWAPPSRSLLSSVPTTSSPLAGTKGHATPKSPLRQVTLPESLDEDEDEDEDDDSQKMRGGETEIPVPLSPLFLCTSPLSFSTDLAPISED